MSGRGSADTEGEKEEEDRRVREVRGAWEKEGGQESAKTRGQERTGNGE